MCAGVMWLFSYDGLLIGNSISAIGLWYSTVSQSFGAFFIQVSTFFQLQHFGVKFGYTFLDTFKALNFAPIISCKTIFIDTSVSESQIITVHFLEKMGCQ